MKAFSTAALLAVWTLLSGPILAAPSGWGARCVVRSQDPVGSIRNPIVNGRERAMIDGAQAGYWKHASDGYQYRELDGSIVGAYDADRKLWFPLINGEYAEEDAIPYDRDRRGRQGVRNEGLEANWVEAAGERPEVCTVGGKKVSLQEALKTIGNAKGDVPDYSKMARLTILSRSPDLRERVAHDLRTAPAMQDFKDKLLIAAYDPAHWHTEELQLDKNPHFARTGFALIYQPPADDKGQAEPLARWQYDGPEATAEALRKAGPAYDPKNIKELPGSPLAGVPWVYLVGGSLAVLAVAIAAMRGPRRRRRLV